MAEYTKINHPVAGQIEIRTDKLKQMSPQELNDMLVDHVANQLKEQGVELSSFDALTGQFARELTSTSRGVQERLGADATTDYEADFLSEVAFKTNPKAAWTGLLAGAILDPVTFLNPLVKYGRVASILGGAGAGATAGFLTPVREEFGESTAVTTGAGAVLGGTLAAIHPSLAKLGDNIAKKLGFKSEQELQKAIEEASPEEKQALTETVQSEVQKEVEALQQMGERQRQTQANRAEQEAELERIRNIDIRPEQVTDPAKLADIESIRQVGKDADVAAIRKIGEDAVSMRDAEVKARIDELRAEVNDLPTGTQQKAIEASVKENNAYIKSLETKAANIEKAINGIKNNKKIPPKKKREQVQPLQAELKRLQDAAALRRQQNKDTYEPLATRIKDLRRVQQELRVYDKTGELPPSLKINKPVQRTQEEIDQLELQDIPAELRQPRAEPELQAIPEALRQPRQPVQEAVPQAAQDPTLDVPQFGAENRSAGSAGVSTKLTKGALKGVANLDLRTREAKALGDPAGAAGKVESGSKEAKQTAAMQAMEEPYSHYWQADSISGKLTFDKIGREAEDITDFVNMDINDGNYRNAADWLFQTFKNQGNMLTPAQIRVADQLWNTARKNLNIGLKAIKELDARDGQFTDKMIANLNGIQTDQALYDMVNSMRSLLRTEEGSKAAWSAAGREFNRIKKLAEAQYQEYRKDNIVSSLILGVKCK